MPFSENNNIFEEGIIKFPFLPLKCYWINKWNKFPHTHQKKKVNIYMYIYPYLHHSTYIEHSNTNGFKMKCYIYACVNCEIHLLQARARVRAWYASLASIRSILEVRTFDWFPLNPISCDLYGLILLRKRVWNLTVLLGIKRGINRAYVCGRSRPTWPDWWSVRRNN